MNNSGVYFILCESEPSFIKIGYSYKAENRLQQLALWCPFRLTRLAVTPGDKTLEVALHRAFEAQRVRGEWFNDCPEIRAVVEMINAGRLQDHFLGADFTVPDFYQVVPADFFKGMQS